MNRIANKQEFYNLSRKLLLGNILNQWTWEQFLVQCRARTCGEPHQLPSNGIVGVRHVRKSFTNKGTSELLPIDDAIEYGLKTPDKENLFFDEGAIHDHQTIQGELMAGERGLYVRYSELQVHQRTLWHIDHHGITGLKKFQLPHNLHVMTEAQKRGEDPVVKHVEGLRAVCLLKHYMDTESYEMIQEILSCQLDGELESFNFSFPVIEFACFDKRVGQLQQNTLVWEVRTDY